MLMKQPMVPERFIRYELQMRNGAVLAEHRTRSHLLMIQEALRKNRNMYTEIHKVTTRGHTFVG